MNAPVDFAAIKGRQQMAWASGDYAVIGTTLQIVGESLAEACELNWDEDVLDVAAGNGNATLAAARRGARVTSTDYVSTLLERGAARARAWQGQLATAQDELLRWAALVPGEHVLDVACGTGLIALKAADAVGPSGHVVGIDLSGRMVDAARRRADECGASNVAFVRMDAEKLELPDASFDVVLCALGLMYMADPAKAIGEMRRVLRPGGRMAVIVWGDRSLCGWSPLFSILDAEVESEVCPLFFRLGENTTLAELCADTGFDVIRQRRIATTLEYADADEACRAAFIGGPVALAWSRFDDAVRSRVRQCYVESLGPWRHGRGYRVPGEFVIVEAATQHALAHASRQRFGLSGACREKE